MLLYVPIGDKVLTLRLTGAVYLRAFDLLMAPDAAEDATRSQRVGLSLLALGLPSIRDAAWPVFADRGGLLEMSGAALDLVMSRLVLHDAMQLARTVALAVLDPMPAPRAAPEPAAPVEPPTPRGFGVRRPPADPYDGTRVDGETWPEFCLRTDGGKKPGSEAALERWKVIEQEFSAPKEG